MFIAAEVAEFNDWERYHLEDELWGDDDVIVGGVGGSDYGEWIWGGDGDDDITMGEGWGKGFTHGGDGDDKIHDRGMIKPAIRGGRGDDTITTRPYGNSLPPVTAPSNYFGEEGNDYIEGAHKYTGN